MRFLAYFGCDCNFNMSISQISEIRERQYEKMGIGSSYLFRLDDGYVVSHLCNTFNSYLVYVNE
jgi:hypothetical protein